MCEVSRLWARAASGRNIDGFMRILFRQAHKGRKIPFPDLSKRRMVLSIMGGETYIVDRAVVGLLVFCAGTAQVLGAGAIRINEIRIDQPGADNDEYFELAGPPDTTLKGLTYLAIGDSPGGFSGVVEVVVDLTGQLIGPSGFFVAAEREFSLGQADFTTTLNFENSDNVTHLLVPNFTGTNGRDLDTNDDGILDLTPWDQLFDLIALIVEENPPQNTEYHYGPPTIGPDGSVVPGHAFRCESEGAWTIGALDPIGGDDTPGQTNVRCGDGGPPDVQINELRIDQPGGDDDEYFELKGEVGASLDGATYLVIGDSPASASGVIEAVIDLTGNAIGPTGFFVAAEATFSLGLADLTTSLNFENSDIVTHLLVFNFSGANGADLDIDDDGTLDLTPWEVVIDLIALVEDDPPMDEDDEFHCGPPVIGPTKDGQVPGQVYRCEPGRMWTIGAFDPAKGTDTPAAPNPDCDGNVCPWDLDRNGIVGASDLLALLANWGPCP